MFLKPDVALEAHNLGIKFSRNVSAARRNGFRDFARAMLWREPHDRLRPGEFWSLRGISFELRKQEALGVIGLNGSGKTTLLKIINGIYRPDQGWVATEGETGALIELGAGIHPELSGRENIYIKCALLGMARDEVDELIEPIIEFSELRPYMDASVKNYSSGMLVRLGFSVIAHTRPDILLMDEVLAVGDFKFRQKCMDRLNRMREHASVILVSHSDMHITRFCDRALVLEQGKMAFLGSPDDAVKFYTESGEQSKEDEKKRKPTHAPSRAFYGDIYRNPEKICDVSHCWTNGEGQVVERVSYGDQLVLEFSFRLKVRVKQLIIGIPIWTVDGVYATAMSTDQSQCELKANRDGWVTGRLIVDPVLFNPGDYVSVVAIVGDNEFFYRQLNPRFSVSYEPRRFGVMLPPHRWYMSSTRDANY